MQATIGIAVRGRDGSQKMIVAQEGHSVMEALRVNGFDEVLALCGGCCSCATCHVYVDEGSLVHLPPMSADEDDLLDSSGSRQPNSRLSCQLLCTSAIDGLRVEIAPED